MYCYGIGNYYSYNNDFIDFPSLFYKLISCIHSLGGIIPVEAKHIATVSPSSFYNSGLWYQLIGGITPYLARYMATVSL